MELDRIPTNYNPNYVFKEGSTYHLIFLKEIKCRTSSIQPTDFLHLKRLEITEQILKGDPTYNKCFIKANQKKTKQELIETLNSKVKDLERLKSSVRQSMRLPTPPKKTSSPQIDPSVYEEPSTSMRSNIDPTYGAIRNLSTYAEPDQIYAKIEPKYLELSPKAAYDVNYSPELYRVDINTKKLSDLTSEFRDFKRLTFLILKRNIERQIKILEAKRNDNQPIVDLDTKKKIKDLNAFLKRIDEILNLFNQEETLKKLISETTRLIDDLKKNEPQIKLELQGNSYVLKNSGKIPLNEPDDLKQKLDELNQKHKKLIEIQKQIELQIQYFKDNLINIGASDSET